MSQFELAQMNGARLEILRTRGPGPEAFTFGTLFPSPDRPGSVVHSLDTPCPAT